ncbi:hypothetical protein GRI44_08895 [Altererythrobacter confluentis]|uniref:Uncharacterized protein n=1 Tax=Allopontixanthobacter confluentis TaxID=1849021 RepID=A0A6L7GGZ3_9SPHN|nr:hypothetical protein [Allopontixanthobacter confluentis]MXP14860.1 hypothetical protein [Allopontixanthobacter confluentis]
MRVRKLITETKVITTTSKWSDKDMPPRWCPINSKTRPIRGGWHWRAAHATSPFGDFTAVAQVNSGRGNWKAVLILNAPNGPSVVARFEHHDSHPGLHVHSHCKRSGIEIGAVGMDGLDRFPPLGNRHRRENAWTEISFWTAMKKFFRMRDDDPEGGNLELFGTF